MDTKKTGELIRCLRRESGMTQERFAEQFHVSSRAVSRWETGSNLPDLDILIEMADRYGLDIRELIDGERRGAPAGRAQAGAGSGGAARPSADERAEPERKPAESGTPPLGAADKTAGMDRETRDTLDMVADYADAQRRRLASRLWSMTAVAAALFMVFLVLRFAGLDGATAGWEKLSNFILGLTAAALALNMMYCSGRLERLWEAKRSLLSGPQGR